jgi:uncharacterized protein (DUF1499 family)
MLFMNASSAGAEPGGPAALKPCPKSPNCVSSLAATARHRIEPLAAYQSADRTMQILKEVVAAYPRTRILTEESAYLHVEFRVATGFRDDVEFLIDASSGLVHVRSASRIGYWDFGANRRRVETFRRMYNERIRVR